MYGKECRWLRECWWCVQIAQTVLSGSKGLMLFQTYHEVISRTNMSLVRNTIHAMRTVSEAIRTGDIGGVGFTVSSKLNEEVMVETILSPTQLLVTVINIDAKGYSNLLCHGKGSSFLCIFFQASKRSCLHSWRGEALEVVQAHDRLPRAGSAQRAAAALGLELAGGRGR